MINLEFYKGKKVFVTGHTGFKGTWLCKILANAGAIVTGYSIDVPSTPNLYELSNIDKYIDSNIGDIRDLKNLKKVFEKAKPEIVIHLAAQPLVLEGYRNPVYTYQTNVNGTVNILECIKKCDTVKSFINITTDKVYENKKGKVAYREEDILNGTDPYSNSKSCSELVTSSYKKTLADMNVSLSIARAGNVIGGGDFAKDRIIPDCIRAALKKENIILRNPNSVRPYQHVLDALFAYLLIVEKQYNDKKYSGIYNVGPEISKCITTGELVTMFCEKWGEDISWRVQNIDGPYEQSFLKLDCSKIRNVLGWKEHWDIEHAIAKTVEFTKAYRDNENISECMDKQIEEYKNNIWHV